MELTLNKVGNLPVLEDNQKDVLNKFIKNIYLINIYNN